MHLMSNTALPGATYDIEGGEQVASGARPRDFPFGPDKEVERDHELSRSTSGAQSTPSRRCSTVAGAPRQPVVRISEVERPRTAAAPWRASAGPE